MTATVTGSKTLAELLDEVGGRVACLAMSKDPNAKVTILLFPPGQDRPGYVAKVPTTDAAARRVEGEAAILAGLAARELGPAGPTIPRLVTMVEHLGRPVLVTTALPGRAMNAAYHTWRHIARPDAVRQDFAAAGQWLAALQDHTASGQVELASMLDGTAAAITRRFGADDQDSAQDLRHLDALQARLAGHQIPRTVVHGDFWPGNLLISAGRASGVIDWEEARLEGPPAGDVVRFVIAYSLYLDRHTRAGRRVGGHPGLRAGQWGAGLDYAIDGSGWYPDLARSFVADALERIGAPASCGRDAMLAGLLAIAAEADHPEFAREHLLLFRRLAGRGQP